MLLRESRGMGLHKNTPNLDLAAKVHSLVFGCAILYVSFGAKAAEPNPEKMCLSLIEEILGSG